MSKHFNLLIFTMLWAVSVLAQPNENVTGNLVNGTVNANISTSTWQNAGLINQGLPCWTPADAQNGAYCGPLPYANNNTVNFSYGMTDIYQKVNVGKALPFNGAGLVTTGFKFAWESKNGNYWDDARQDYLTAYVKLYSTGDKKVVENFQWDLNYIHNWTVFDYDKNWANTKLGYRENQVGNVQFGFIGMDNNSFAGPYGPEIRNISFQLKYKPDPCKNNPLFSPECPNFAEALSKNTTITNTTEPKFDTAITVENTDNNMKVVRSNHISDGSKEEGVDKPNYMLEDTLIRIFDNQIHQEEKSLNIAQDAIDKTEKASERATKQAESIAKESQTKSIKDSIEFNPDTTGSATGLKRDNQDNIFSLIQGPNSNAGSVVGFSLLVPNTQIHLPPTKDKLEQTIPTTTTINNLTPMQANVSSLSNLNRNLQEQSNITNERNFMPLNTINPISISVQNKPIVQQNNQTSISISTEQNANLPVLQPQVTTQSLTVTTQSQITNQSMSINTPIVEQQGNQINSNLIDTKPTVSTNIDIPIIQANFLTNKADPINDIIDNKPNNTNEQKQETKTQTVKQNVQDNDVVGSGVKITQLAIAPVGFNQYTNFVLQDATFYAPKEIYRNQKNVDNTRALRQLASDRLHQDMVNQQYRR